MPEIIGEWKGSNGYYCKTLTYPGAGMLGYAEIERDVTGKWRARFSFQGKVLLLKYTKTLKESKAVIDARIANLLVPFLHCTAEEKQVVRDALLAHVTPGRTQCPFKRALDCLELEQ